MKTIVERSHLLAKVEKAIRETWPWIPTLDSVGDPWVYNKERAIECGYANEDDYFLIGFVGMEDAVCLFDETDQPCMYERCEELQETLGRHGDFFLEPYYSFLWLIWLESEEVGS